MMFVFVLSIIFADRRRQTKIGVKTKDVLEPGSSHQLLQMKPFYLEHQEDLQKVQTNNYRKYFLPFKSHKPPCTLMFKDISLAYSK